MDETKREETQEIPGEKKPAPNPENTAKQVYEKDKDPDERALGSEGGRKSQMPDYDRLRKE